MWLHVCTAEQINSYTSLILDTAASLEFNLLKLFEELEYPKLCLKLSYVLSCSCSTVWCFQAITQLLGCYVFFHWLLKGTLFYHVVLKLEYFNFVDILSRDPWNPQETSLFLWALGMSSENTVNVIRSDFTVRLPRADILMLFSLHLPSWVLGLGFHIRGSYQLYR